MKKNKIISILLLLITILLSIGLGMSFIYNHDNNTKESFISTDEEQYLTYVNTHQLMMFTHLLSNDSTDIQSNIYTIIAEAPYYFEYLNNIPYPLSGLDNYYPLAQFLQPNEIHSPLKTTISLSRLPYMNPFFTYDPISNTNTPNIQTDDDFKRFINSLYPQPEMMYGPLIPHKDLTGNNQNFMKNLVKHYHMFQDDYLSAVEHPYTANMLELLEMLYVSTIVPTSLFHIYRLPYNYVVDQFPITFTDNTTENCTNAILCNANSYNTFIQMYHSAMQMQFSINSLVDKDGNSIKGVDFSTSKKTDIKMHIQKMMYMFDGQDPKYLSDLVQGLEPSYILFYNALYFFYVKCNNIVDEK